MSEHHQLNGTMSRTTACSEIRSRIVEAIEEAQTLSGEPEVELSDETCIFGDLPNFDSLRAAEVSVSLEGLLGLEAHEFMDLFTPDPDARCLTLGKMIERACSELQASSGEEIDQQVEGEDG